MAGLTSPEVDYFDIMLVGMTGQGKSTMVDKLLIANPKVLPKHFVTTKDDQLEDMSMGKKLDPSVPVHLECLEPNPHAEVNDMRDPEKTSTSSCQVFSNDATKVRILDVPGFEDEKAFLPQPQLQQSQRQAVREHEPSQLRMFYKMFKKAFFPQPSCARRRVQST